MSAPKWTPGPWTYWVWGGSKPQEMHGLPCSFGVPCEDEDGAERDDGGLTIAEFAECEHSDLPREEQLANAHLIAAAPALYEALEDAEGVLGAVASRCDVVAEDVKAAAVAALGRVWAALALARGEDSK